MARLRLCPAVTAAIAAVRGLRASADDATTADDDATAADDATTADGAIFVRHMAIA